MGAAVLVLAMMAGQGSEATRQPAPEPAVSVGRVREGLQRPALKIPQIEFVPVFRAAVEETPFDNPLQGARRELAAESGYGGKSGIDILAPAMSVVRSIRSAYRAHTEARVRKEVQAVLDAFCVEHDCSTLEDGPPPMEGIVLPRKAP